MTTRPGYVWDSAVSEWVAIGQSAVVAPVAYQASAPSTPATGDIWIDSDDEVPSVDSTLYYRWTKTMSGGETSLSGTDNNSLSLQYTPGYESVFINGVLQARNLDYTATSGSTISGLTALVANDIVMVESIVAYSVGDTYTQSTLNSMFSPITTTGLVLLNTTTVGTTVSSIVFNDVFTTTYKNYLIYFNTDSSTFTATGTLTFRLRKAGSSNTATEYRSNGYISVSSSLSNDSRTATGLAFARTNTSGGSRFASLEVFSPKDNAKTGYKYDNAGFDGVPQQITESGNGFHNVVDTFDGFEIIVSSGTMTGGTIAVYGYK